MSSPREQAARWFTRLLDVPEDHPDRARFEVWMRADAQHRVEYQAFCELWGDFTSTRKTQALAQSMEKRSSRRVFMRNGLLGLSGLLVAGLAWRYGSRTGAYEQQFFTRRGEQLKERLPDGSEIVLGANTRVQVRYEGLQRQVFLMQGEVIFDVVHAADRPFIVDAGLARVTVLGTRFVVNRLDDRLRVSVERGKVQLDGDAASLQLTQDQVGEIRRDQPLRRLVIPATNAFAFERGRLIFTQADLAEIAESISRYREQPVRSITGKKSPLITAVVQLSDIDSFLSALPKIAAVEVEQSNGVTQLRAR
ncbi:FecR family protein [Pseudomonas syringae group sp. J309-1]|uniref:FecR family protein n=1 Tax=Pseudomonas syringae group sp. J309-1 TaxID=3079588 RepID=UPI0029119D48|nr:FecR domain-containing protein [Pseudomonas syringae group sp. J309-1]MDU8357189.1 FecR domain-containing protein [Pseudomonas syringae group sp. J309-1]